MDVNKVTRDAMTKAVDDPKKIEMTPLYKALGRAIPWLIDLQSSDHLNTLWEERVDSWLDALEQELPSGSGIDCGTKIDREKSKENKIVLLVEYHHTNENGFYDGWTAHNIVITPSFVQEFDLRITGPNRNNIKEYLADVYDIALRGETRKYPEWEE